MDVGIRKLSVVIPCYNEQRTIADILQKVISIPISPIDIEIVVVDDGSTDKSLEILEGFARNHPEKCIVISSKKNQGKGAALIRALKETTGDVIVIQDADLEYDPIDFLQMAPLFHLPQVNVVFGSRRMLPGNPISGSMYYFGAQIINGFTNILYGARLTDQFTCYKMFRRDLLDSLKLHSPGFEFDAELTAKLLRLNEYIQEVPITYRPRSEHEGKKIRWRDGVQWLWQIIVLRFTSPKSW